MMPEVLTFLGGDRYSLRGEPSIRVSLSALPGVVQRISAGFEVREVGGGGDLGKGCPPTLHLTRGFELRVRKTKERRLSSRCSRAKKETRWTALKAFPRLSGRARL